MFATCSGATRGASSMMTRPVLSSRYRVFSGSGTPAVATSLDIQLQGAVDPGTGNTSGCTYVAYLGTEPIPLASILASNRLAAFDFPRRRVGAAMPRFIALNYVVAGSNFTGLTLTSYINLGGTSAQATPSGYGRSELVTRARRRGMEYITPRTPPRAQMAKE